MNLVPKRGAVCCDGRRNDGVVGLRCLRRGKDDVPGAAGPACGWNVYRISQWLSIKGVRKLAYNTTGTRHPWYMHCVKWEARRSSSGSPQPKTQ